MKLLLTIGPTGFDDVNIEFIEDNKHIDLFEITRGEGQALLFNLEDYDCSNDFSLALRDGRVIRNLENKFHKVNIERNE